MENIFRKVLYPYYNKRIIELVHKEVKKYVQT